MFQVDTEVDDSCKINGRMVDQKLWEEILLKLLGIMRCVTNAKRKIIKYSGLRYLQQGTESLILQEKAWK